MNQPIDEYIQSRYFSIAAFLVNEAKHSKDIVKSLDKLEGFVRELRQDVEAHKIEKTNK